MWIPKALAGLNADNWRPLGLPTTFLRILSASIYNKMQQTIIGMLHPSQALLNDFREPQGNFMDAHKALRSKSSKGSALVVVALTDYMKAFEIVNPKWILAVLQARKAPLWLLSYARYVLNGRKVYRKLQGKLLSFIHVVVGVDMGSAISPLFFCLAMDPLLVSLNRIPRVLGVRAYMDDNQIWGRYLAWLRQFQHQCDAMKSAGLIIVQHTCCSFAPGGRQCAVMRDIVPTNSWIRAAEDALSAAPQAAWFVPQGTALQVPRLAMQRLVHAREPTLLTRLCALPCKCKTKNSYLPNRQLSTAEIAELDQLPWGAKPLLAATTVLGITLASKAGRVLPLHRAAANRLVNKERFEGRRYRQIAKEAEHKIETKAAHRARSLARTITPLPHQAAAHGGWIQALSY